MHESRVNVSAIVATKNSARTLRALLESLRAQSLPGLEVIVVDNHSADGTDRIAHELADVVITAGPERSAQRNVGIRAAKGTYVCVLDADMRLEPGVLQSAFELAEKGAEAVTLPERSFGRGFWARVKEAERRAYEADESTCAARFFRRDTAIAAGLYDETLTGPEDWDLSMRILGVRKMLFAQGLVHHDEGEPKLFELFKKRRYYGAGYKRFIKKHGWAAAKKFSPGRRSLLLETPRLIRDPILFAGVITLKATEAAGVLTGMVLGPGGGGDAVYSSLGEAHESTSTG